MSSEVETSLFAWLRIPRGFYIVSSMNNAYEPRRMLNALLALMGCSFLLACLTASPIFNGLIAAGRAWPALSALRDLEYERVISRLLLIYMLIGFYPALRYGGGRNLAVFGLTSMPGRGRAVAKGWIIGLASVLLLLIPAWWSGAYLWAPDPWDRIAGRFAGYLIGGLLIGLIEEVLFRGALFGSLRRLVHGWPAALVVSVCFAFVHFMRPASPGGIVHGELWTGFQLIPHLIHVTKDHTFYFPFGLTLFLMSLTLCAFYLRHGHVYFIIGLHAGWVVALQTARFFFNQNQAIESLWYATSNVSRTYAASALICAFLLYAVLARRQSHA